MRRPAQSTQLPRPPASTPDASNIGLPLGVILLWLLLAAAAVGVLVIYWRTPVVELYHVTASGPREGVRRMLSFAGYPAALVAAAIALLVADRLHVRTVLLASVGTVVLGASALWAGTTDEADVDTRPVSIAALAGLAISISLSGLLARRLGVVSLRHESGDRRRLVAGLLVLVLALPWIARFSGYHSTASPCSGRSTSPM